MANDAIQSDIDYRFLQTYGKPVDFTGVIERPADFQCFRAPCPSHTYHYFIDGRSVTESEYQAAMGKLTAMPQPLLSLTGQDVVTLDLPPEPILGKWPPTVLDEINDTIFTNAPRDVLAEMSADHQFLRRHGKPLTFTGVVDVPCNFDLAGEVNVTGCHVDYGTHHFIDGVRVDPKEFERYQAGGVAPRPRNLLTDALFGGALLVIGFNLFKK